MSRRSALAALVAPAVLLAAGCFPLEGPYDPIEQAKRDAEAAERGIVRRGRKALWFLVRSWLDTGKHDITGPTVVGKGYGEALFSVGKSGMPPEAPHFSILLRQGQSGFVALRRGAPVSGFDLAGKTYGGGETRADRGFDITVRLPAPDVVDVSVTPVFRGLAEGGGDLRLEELAFEKTLSAQEALALSGLGLGGPIARAFWEGAPRSDEGGERRRLYIQVEPFR